MNASHVLDERAKIHFTWLIRLRWMALIGQLFAIFLSQAYVQLELPLTALLFVVFLSAASNVGAVLLARKIHPSAFMSWIVVLDVLLLTFLLYFSGGPINPFSSLYLVHIVLALIILQGAWAWAVMCVSLFCFAALFYFHQEIPNFHEGHHDMSTHLQGMWVALGITSVVIVYFVRHILSSIRDLETEVEHSRESLRRREQLHSLGTLAAGAAHELATPLSTIAMVAKELERKLSQDDDERMKQDVLLIRKEVERCKKILMDMSAYGAQQPGEEIKAVILEEFVGLFTSMDPRVKLIVSDHETKVSLHLPVQAVRICIQNLVQNALDASQGPVVLQVKIIGDRIQFTVRDEGVGMSADTVKKLGEPFFTTKEPGKGMGLGVFIARSIVEQIEGQIHYHSTPMQGTTVTVSFPMSLKGRE